MAGTLLCLEACAGQPLEPVLQGTWKPIAELLIPVRAPAVATDGQRIYVFGGSAGGNVRTAHTQILDPATGRWTKGANVPQATEWAGAVWAGGRFHLLGGVTDAEAATAKHWVYNPASDSWTAGPPLPAPAAGSAVGLVDGKIVVAGGIDGPGHHSTNLHLFNVASGVWSPGPPVPTPRINWQGAVIGGSFFVAGGAAPGRVTAASLYSLDVRSGVWSSLQPLPAQNEGYGGTEFGGLYCVIGGRVTPASGSFNTPFDRVDCFDPKRATWLEGPRLPIAVEEPGAVSVGSALYAIGGRITVDGVTGAVYRLDS